MVVCYTHSVSNGFREMGAQLSGGYEVCVVTLSIRVGYERPERSIYTNQIKQ